MRFKTFLEVYGSSFNYKVPSDKETLLYDFYMIYNLSGISDSLTDRVGKMHRSGMDVPPGANKWSQGGEPELTAEDKIDYTIKEVRSKILPKLKQDLLEAVFFSICAESRHIFDNNNPQKVLSVVEEKFGEEGKNLIRRYSKYYYQQESGPLSALARPINDVPSRQISPSKDSDSYVKSFKAAMKATGSDVADKFTTNEEQAKFVKIFQYLFFATDDDSISAYRKNRATGHASKPPTKAAWSSMYGGLPWADIARGWLELLRATTENQMMVQIDHVYDLQHNTSTVFNKLASYAKNSGHSWVKNALDFKAHIKEPHELIKRVSPTMRKLALTALKIKTGRTLEDYEKENKINKTKKPEASPDDGFGSTPAAPDPNLSPEQQKLKELRNKVSQMAEIGGFAFSDGRRAARTMIINAETPSGVKALDIAQAYKTANALFGFFDKSKFDSFVTAEKSNIAALSFLEGANIDGVTKEQVIALLPKLNITVAFRPGELTSIQNMATSLLASGPLTSLNKSTLELTKHIKNNVSPYTTSLGMLYAKGFILIEWSKLDYPPLINNKTAAPVDDKEDSIYDEEIAKLKEFIEEQNVPTSIAIARFAFYGKWKPKQIKDICAKVYGDANQISQVNGKIASYTKNYHLMKSKNFQFENDQLDNVFTGEEEEHIKSLLKNLKTGSASEATTYANVDAYIRIKLYLAKDEEGVNISQFYRKWLINKLQPSTPTGPAINKSIADSAKSIAKYIIGKPAEIIGRLMAGTGLNFATVMQYVYNNNKELMPLKVAAEFYAKQENKNFQVLKHFEPTMVNVLKNKNGYQDVINNMKEQGFKLQLPIEITSKIANFERYKKALGYSDQLAGLYKLYIEIMNENFNDLL